uniref:Uncharacterized protein n=1 Tax=Trichobilharzia regenti TaxID=157069 RepID=A0AA85JX88_TRIRE|nr:unnamed protein product [Trichobilharzia regenti]
MTFMHLINLRENITLAGSVHLNRHLYIVQPFLLLSLQTAVHFPTKLCISSLSYHLILITIRRLLHYKKHGSMNSMMTIWFP